MEILCWNSHQYFIFLVAFINDYYLQLYRNTFAFEYWFSVNNGSFFFPKCIPFMIVFLESTSPASLSRTFWNGSSFDIQLVSEFREVFNVSALTVIFLNFFDLFMRLIIFPSISNLLRKCIIFPVALKIIHMIFFNWFM